MKKFEEDKSFLARWVDNRLSPEELKEFQEDEDFALLDRINKEASTFRIPKANVDGDYQKVKAKIASKGKVISLNRFYYVAASVAVLLGLFWFVNSSKTISAEFGEKVLAELPDGSKVHLNSGSEISYKRFFWNKDRTVKLEGEAYFEVQQSETSLKVISESGQVEVLGTKFNVLDRKQQYEIICYSGKVSVKKKDSSKEYILQKGDKITITADQNFPSKVEDTTPDWMNGISIFKGQPLINVLESLERQYDVTIEVKGIDTTQIFTGSFVHNDLSSALKTTLPVMGISYQISKDKKTISIR